MMTYLDSLLSPTLADNVLLTVQRRFVRLLAIIGIVLGTGLFLAALLERTPGLSMTYAMGFVLFNLAVLALVGFRLVELAGLLVTLAYLLVAFSWPAQFLLFGLLAMSAAGILLAYPVYIAAFIALLIRFSLLLRAISPVAPTGGPSDELVSMLLTWMLVVLSGLGTRYLLYELQRAVQSRQRTALLLQATTEVGQVVTNIRDLNRLFNRTIELIQDRFGFYHVQVFIVEGDQAELTASTGKVGERLLANRHRLAVGSNSIVGRATRDGQRVLARNADSDAVHRPNPLLPDTQAELAIPLFDGERVIGVLDIQSHQQDSFHPEDIDALESMASLLSAAISNVRLFDVQERSVREQERLYRESETNFREIQRLNQQLTRSAWDQFVEQAPSATGVTLHENQILSDSAWDEVLIEAALKGEPIVRQANGRPGVMALPVVVRGEVIGAMEVELDESTDWQTSLEMLNAVSERLATSLENARLFEEARAATAQEQLINQLVTQYQASPSVDDLLRITLTELSSVLGAERGAIRLGRAPQDEGGLLND